MHDSCLEGTLPSGGKKSSGTKECTIRFGPTLMLVFEKLDGGSMSRRRDGRVFEGHFGGNLGSGDLRGVVFKKCMG